MPQPQLFPLIDMAFEVIAVLVLCAAPLMFLPLRADGLRRRRAAPAARPVEHAAPQRD